MSETWSSFSGAGEPEFKGLVLDQVEELMADSLHRLKTHRLAQLSLEHLSSGGRRLRARLALDVGKALGVETHLNVSWAAACELLHNATLVLDDIQDQDEERRGQPTLWAKHGLPAALNVGELLLMLPHWIIKQMHLPAERQVELLGKMTDTCICLVSGQMDETTLQDQLERVDLWQSYLEAISGKTSPLFELPVWGNVFIATGDVALAQRWAQPFRHFGVVFQLADDLADVLGKKEGRRRGADLMEGKVSALIPLYLKDRPEKTQELKRFLQTDRGQLDTKIINYWLEEFESQGIFDELHARILYWLKSFGQSSLRQEQPEVYQIGVFYLRQVLSTFGYSQDEDFYGIL